MDNSNKELTSANKDNKKQITLTSKNKLFLDYLTDGYSVVDAYKKAGYNGTNHAAYELKSYLSQELGPMLEAKGFTLEGLASDIEKLNRIPLHESAMNGVTLNQKINILRLKASCIPKQAAPGTNTSFTTINFNALAPKAKEPTIDVEANEERSRGA